MGIGRDPFSLMRNYFVILYPGRFQLKLSFTKIRNWEGPSRVHLRDLRLAADQRVWVSSNSKVRLGQVPLSPAPRQAFPQKPQEVDTIMQMKKLRLEELKWLFLEFLNSLFKFILTDS